MVINRILKPLDGDDEERRVEVIYQEGNSWHTIIVNLEVLLNSNKAEEASDKISELEEQIEEAESQADDLQEEMDKDIPDCNLQETEDKINELEGKIEHWKGAIETLQDGEVREVYQYYIVSKSAFETWLKGTGELVLYNDELDMYVWCICFYGADWRDVLTDIPIPEQAAYAA